MFKQNYFLTLLLLSAGLFFPSQELFAQSKGVDGSDYSIDKANKYSRFQLSIDGGLGYLLGSTKTAKDEMKGFGISDQEADRYYNEIKLGEQAGASVHYMVFRQMGVGIDYNIFTTNSEVKGTVMSSDQTTLFYGRIKEKIYTNFIGLSIFQNLRITEKVNLYGNLSAGIAFYRDESYLIIAPALITGNAFAMKGESGISYDLSRHLSINVGVSYLLSSLKKIKLSDGTKSSVLNLEGNSKENLSRLNVSTGIQFHF